MLFQMLAVVAGAFIQIGRDTAAIDETFGASGGELAR